MQYRFSALPMFVLGLALVATTPAIAESPWAALIPFKRVEADPKKEYTLGEEHGPWLILVANFAGATAETQARELVLELRSRFGLQAYMHKQSYDFTQTVHGTKLTPYGDLAPMRYVNATKFDGVAVLVGHFRSVEDAQFEKTLDRVKELQPDCLAKNKRPGATEPWAGVRELKRRLRLSSTGQQPRGPMATAFATRNPLLPDEVYSPNGVDEFVARLNKGVDYSLLDNPGRYTVRVATFRGNRTINQREIQEIESRDKLTNKLEVAADKAHRLTVALRERGVEAFEFHDRTESIVTIGSFNSEQNAAEIQRIIQQYQGTERPIPGKGVIGVEPRSLSGISFDIQPGPIEVPRRSIAADY